MTYIDESLVKPPTKLRLNSTKASRFGAVERARKHRRLRDTVLYTLSAPIKRFDLGLLLRL